MINQDPYSSYSSTDPTRPAPQAANAVSDSRLPQTLGGVFDEAFDLYKRHFITLALLTAIIYLPVQFMMHAAFDTWLLPLTKEIGRAADAQPEPVLWFMAGAFFTGVPQAGIPGLFTLFAIALASGPVTFAVSQFYSGKPVTVREAYRAMRGRWARLFGGCFLTGTAFTIAAVVTSFVILMCLGLLAAVLSGIMPSEAIGILVLVSMIIPYGVGCAAVAVWFAFTSQIVVLEGLPVTDVFSRNWTLVGKRRFWRTFGALVGLPFVLIGLQSLILLSIQATIGNLKSAPVLEFIITCTLSAATSFFFTPYPIIFLTLFYYDTRIRREGLDVRMLSDSVPTLEGGAAVANPTPPPVVMPAAAASPIPFAAPSASMPATSPAPANPSGLLPFMDPSPAAAPPPVEAAEPTSPRSDTEVV